MFAVDPPTFQQAALAWLGVFTVVASTALGAALMLWPKVQQLRDAMQTHQQAIVENNQAVRAINPDAPSVQPVDINKVEVKQ